jgi:hypothetical protein
VRDLPDQRSGFGSPSRRGVCFLVPAAADFWAPRLEAGLPADPAGGYRKGGRQSEHWRSGSSHPTSQCRAPSVHLVTSSLRRMTPGCVSSSRMLSAILRAAAADVPDAQSGVPERRRDERHIRSEKRSAPRYGYKAGPNLLFFGRS